MQRSQLLPPIDLDDPKTWMSSGRAAVEAYWRYYRDQFKPPLGDELVTAAVERSGGNFLYAIKVRQRLATIPAAERRIDALPFGLKGLLDALWDELQALPNNEAEFVRQGLGLLSVAREALPVHYIELALGWPYGTADNRLLRTLARQAIVEEPAEWHGGKARYRLYHESFAELVRQKMDGELPELHRRLAEHLAAWPPANIGDVFLRSYALRHGITHRTEAAVNEPGWGALERFCLNVGYLTQSTEEIDAQELADAFERAATHCPLKDTAKTLLDMHRALVNESRWLPKEPTALPSLLWNNLLCHGWSAERLLREVTWPSPSTTPRLLHALQRVDQSICAIPTGAESRFCVLSPDGRRAVALCENGTVGVWLLRDGREVARFGDGHINFAVAAFGEPNAIQLLSVERGCDICVRSLDDGQEVLRISVPGEQIFACAVTPNGRYAVSVHRSGLLRAWDLRPTSTTPGSQPNVALSSLGRGVVLGTLSPHRESAKLTVPVSERTACAITPDGARALVALQDHTLALFDLHSGQVVASLKGHQDVIWACVTTSDGKYAVSASSDRTVRVWSLDEGLEISRCDGHDDLIMACAVTPDDSRIVSASYDRTLRVWSLQEGRELARLEGHAKWVISCAVTPNGSQAVSTSGDESIRVWDILEPSTATPRNCHTSDVTDVALDESKGLLVSASRDRTLRLWSIEGGLEISRLEGHADEVTACAMSTDYSRVFSVSRDGTLRVWSLKERCESARFDIGQTTIDCATLADGSGVLFASEGQVWVHPLQGEQQARRVTSAPGIIWSCAATPDASRAVLAGMGTIRVVSLYDGQEVQRLEGHQRHVFHCTVTLAGTHVVSASRDCTLRVWSLDTGESILTLKGHEEPVNACAITPDGTRIVSASDDRTLRVWDLATGRLLSIIYGQQAFRCVVAGRELIVAGDALGNVWFLTDQPFRRPT